MYLLYSGIISTIPVVAESPIGDVLPELKELPVSTRKPGLNHCRRLAVCRATPVYDNYLFQRVNSSPNTNKCTYSSEDCANVEMVLDILDPPKNTPKFQKVYDGQDTELVFTTSEYVFNRAEVCKEAHGTLCWFGKLANGKYRGWNYKDSQNYKTYDLNDPRGKGRGFPTEQVCLHEMSKVIENASGSSPTCVKGVCEMLLNSTILANS
eukprot:847033-Prymnesium_polylepis.1